MYLHLPGYVSFIFSLNKRLQKGPSKGSCSKRSTKMAGTAGPTTPNQKGFCGRDFLNK